MAKPDLVMDWCSSAAAQWAVRNWHYSRSLPGGGVCRIGVWEGGEFVGVVLFSIGSGNTTRGEPYGLARKNQIAELARVALNDTHATPTSRVVAIALRMIRKQSPGLKMIVSYADALEQGHLGIIYQASNWAYLGVSKGGNGFIIEGVRMHNRSIYSRGWKQQLQWLREHIDPNAEPYDSFKHRYGYGLTPEMRAKLSEMSLPYPKAPEASSDVPGSQSGEGGATPTPALN